MTTLKPARQPIIGDPVLRILFLLWAAAHFVFEIAGLAFPRWFFATVPPWPPLHVGQIQIAGVFDLSMAAAFLIAATDVPRYGALMIVVGVVAEWGMPSFGSGTSLRETTQRAATTAPGQTQ